MLDGIIANKMNRISLIVSIIILAFLIGCDDNTENKAPQCYILTPMSGITFYVGDTIPIKAEAIDSDGEIYEIKLYIDGEGVGFSNNDSLSYDWITSNYAEGAHVITFTAIDNLLSTESLSINISLLDVSDVPTVILDSVKNISYNSSVIYGRVIDHGYSALSELGVCWSTSSSPTITSNITSASLSGDSFQVHITEFNPNIKYYFKAYAKNGSGYAYSNQMTTITPENLANIITSSFTDYRDNQEYSTVFIGGVWWLAENLNYYTENSYYYNDDSLTNHSYGRLYNISEAKSVCPPGWHLASDEEWKNLEIALGMSQTEADSEGHRGTNQGTMLKFGGISQFEAKLGGYGNLGHSFTDLGVGYWWSSTEITTGNYYIRELQDISTTVGRLNRSNYDLYSVRCVQD